MDFDRRQHGPRGSQGGLGAAAVPFVALALLLLVGSSTTMLPAGLAFALIVACVLIGALRVLLVYRDVLVARGPRGVAH